ncbi:unnamed protein product, partial [Owenia fusiformis]
KALAFAILCIGLYVIIGNPEIMVYFREMKHEARYFFLSSNSVVDYLDATFDEYRRIFPQQIHHIHQWMNQYEYDFIFRKILQNVTMSDCLVFGLLLIAVFYIGKGFKHVSVLFKTIARRKLCKHLADTVSGTDIIRSHSINSPLFKTSSANLCDTPMKNREDATQKRGHVNKFNYVLRSLKKHRNIDNGIQSEKCLSTSPTDFEPVSNVQNKTVFDHDSPQDDGVLFSKRSSITLSSIDPKPVSSSVDSGPVSNIRKQTNKTELDRSSEVDGLPGLSVLSSTSVDSDEYNVYRQTDKPDLKHSSIGPCRERISILSSSVDPGPWSEIIPRKSDSWSDDAICRLQIAVDSYIRHQKYIDNAKDDSDLNVKKDNMKRGNGRQKTVGIDSEPKVGNTDIPIYVKYLAAYVLVGSFYLYVGIAIGHYLL